MGFMTLSELQDELVDMIGARGPGEGRGSKRLNRLINLGYFELAGAFDFEDLFTLTTIPTVADDKDYTLPTDVISVRSVVDVTNTTNLRRLPIENFLRLDPASTGKPTRWARAGGLLYLWEVPDAVYSIEVGYNKEPVRLSAGADVSVLPGAFDQAILLFAAKFGAMVDGDAQKADMYLSAARLYVNTRIKDSGADFASQSVGVTVATSEEQLTDLES